MAYYLPMNSVISPAVILLIAAGAMSQTRPKDLEHTRWRLVERKGNQATVPSGIAFTLTLEQSSYQFSGCNLLSGKLRIEGQKLIFTEPASSTRKACTATVEAVDVSFARLAGGSPRYRIEKDRLTLEAEGGAGWVFQKEPLASKDAKTKFIYVAAFTKDCTGVVPMKCLQVRESKDQPWSLEYSGIVGFEHVPGIEYYLRIKEDRVARPLADAPSLVWYLDAVIGQSVVDRKAADEYLSSQKH